MPVYFTVYFALAIVLKSVVVARKTGKNPLVLPKNDTTYGLIGAYFKYSLMAIFVYTLAFAFLSQWFTFISTLDKPFFKLTGCLLLVFSLIWTLVAQNDMHNSWRIGIDMDNRTELICSGLFRFSRNPIFLGMLLSLTGLFLVSPNAFTIFFLIIGFVLIQVQIRLEEEFLTKQHGEAYFDYCKKTRRFL